MTPDPNEAPATPMTPVKTEAALARLRTIAEQDAEAAVLTTRLDAAACGIVAATVDALRARLSRAEQERDEAQVDRAEANKRASIAEQACADNSVTIIRVREQRVAAEAEVARLREALEKCSDYDCRNGDWRLCHNNCPSCIAGAALSAQASDAPWRCESCGAEVPAGHTSHGRADHAPYCDGNCKDCPIEVKCGPCSPVAKQASDASKDGGAWHLCPDREVKEGWPEPGAHVLVACYPWRDGEPPWVGVAGFYWEGKDNWRPTFRDGDQVKGVYAWHELPSAPARPSGAGDAAGEGK